MNHQRGNILVPVLKWVGIMGVILFGIVQCSQSKWWVEHERQDQLERQAAATPHVIREADGCKVYAFARGGQEHYFTRCTDGNVTTQRNYTENHGKQGAVKKNEVIVTNGNK